MSIRDLVASVAGVLALASCTSLGVPGAGLQRAHTGAWDSSTLYARDGSEIGASAQAPVNAPAPRELQPSETGRMYLLELYQKAIDERDGLRRELTTLNEDLDQTKTQLAQSQQQQADLQANIARLEAENNQRLQENIDLAARLVTAQIRRLQVEKIVLEQRLAQKHEPAPAAEAPKTP